VVSPSGTSATFLLGLPAEATTVYVVLTCSNSTWSETTQSAPIPASFPVTSMQVPNLPPGAACEATIAPFAGALLCPIDEVTFAMPTLPDLTPALANFQPTSNTSAIIQVVQPKTGCAITQYTVTATPPPSSGAAIAADVAVGGNLAATLANFVPGVAYNLTVVGACSDGGKTPTGGPVSVTAPPASCPAGQYLAVSAAGYSQCAPCTPVIGCSSQGLTCSSGGASTCAACNTALDYNPAPTNGVCECKAGYVKGSDALCQLK
jgi:hypothetical protein